MIFGLFVRLYAKTSNWFIFILKKLGLKCSDKANQLIPDYEATSFLELGKKVKLLVSYLYLKNVYRTAVCCNDK